MTIIYSAYIVHSPLFSHKIVKRLHRNVMFCSNVPGGRTI